MENNMLCFIFGNFAVVVPGRMDGQGLREGREMGWELGVSCSPPGKRVLD